MWPARLLLPGRDPDPAPRIPGLAFTGTELVGPGIGLALMLLALGGGLLTVRRRRQNSDEIDNA
ncbi:DLW-39 family protein [Curtobacterium sp. 1544]|uniref:DLW-39 family protein n=1 Tax=Curtobacterium sp. 1544 TaxID=3156417 RepID=UPI00339922DA